MKCASMVAWCGAADKRSGCRFPVLVCRRLSARARAACWDSLANADRKLW